MEILKNYSGSNLIEPNLSLHVKFVKIALIKNMFPRVLIQRGKFQTEKLGPKSIMNQNHFSLGKVYSAESMREGTLFPGERECTCSFS